MLTKSNLHSYQIDAVKFIKKNRKCALFLDMGLGKTAISLTAIKELMDSFFAFKILVIAPLRVCNSVWKQESKKWEHLKNLKISICIGNKKDREKSLKNNCDILVINKENLPWLVTNYKWVWEMIIIDESTSFKNPSSKRFRYLRKILGKIKSIILLTGTPSPNSLIDLWSQFYLIDRGERLGKTLTNYREKFFVQDYFGYNWKLREDSEKQIKRLISDVSISMSAKDYLTLPEKIEILEIIEMPEIIEKKYKDLEKEFVLEINQNQITAFNAAALTNKLLQFSNGAIYYKNEDSQIKYFEEIHKLKINALKEIVEDNPNENILVAYNFKSDLQRLKQNFKYAVELDKRGEVLEDWNKKKIKMMLAHPMSTGHGLNAQKGGSMIVWFGLNWSLELYQQFNARLHRQGQEKPVRIIHLICKNTIDEKIMQALKFKAKNQNDLLKFLKAKYRI